MIVDYEVMWDTKDIKFVEVGMSGTGSRLNQKPRSSVKKCEF